MGSKTSVGDAQRDNIIAYLRDFRSEHQYMPTVAQIAVHMGIQRNAAVWHIEKLREQKRVKFEDGIMSRSLRF